MMFDDIEVTSDDGEVMVSLGWEGEGNSGDYDPDDSSDQPLLRFSIYRKYSEGMTVPEGFCDMDVYEDGDWMFVNDGSYCTLLSANDSLELLEKAAKLILNTVESDVRDFVRNKRCWEGISWIKAEDIN